MRKWVSNQEGDYVYNPMIRGNQVDYAIMKQPQCRSRNNNYSIRTVIIRVLTVRQYTVVGGLLYGTI